MGGIEEGQTPKEAVHTEIREEVALHNVEIVKKLRWITSARYCASHKKENRCAVAHGYLAEISDLEKQGEISDEEKKLHTLVWVDEKDVLKVLTPDHQKQVWSLLQQEEAIAENGKLMNSDEFDGMDSEEAKEKIIEKVVGEKKVQYRLRDWLLSRQRYWGCPIPIVYDPDGKPHPVNDEHLPWTLPEDVDFTPTGEAPLARSNVLKERTEKLYGKGWTPEVDTMDTFVDSSWYFLRYLDPHNDKEFSPLEKQKLWMPVTKYSGGAEHTTMHVLYSRFFQKALFDLGLVKDEEPYINRMNRGLILGPDGAKMSKSKGNVIDPDEHVKRVGADTVKTYLAFIGPYNEVGQYPWDMGGIAGVRRFFERIWFLKERIQEDVKESEEATIKLQQTIKKVGNDIDAFKFNTAISQMMILVNTLEKEEGITKKMYETVLTLLAPFAPHIAEELWEKLGHETSIHLVAWPEYDDSILQNAVVTIVVQVNGKVRGSFVSEPTLDEQTLLERARAVDTVKAHLEGDVVREIIVPGKLVNFVVKKKSIIFTSGLTL